MDGSNFLSPKGSYKDLIAFQKAECIYDITFYFAHKFLSVSDRTIDQMIQAARSGKQNIAEGNAASVVSLETEIKLIGVAKASFHELLLDYQDFLRVRGLQEWAEEDPRTKQARAYCSSHNDSADYRSAIELRSQETIANIAIVLLRQEDYLLHKLLESIKLQFLKEGGIREQMSKARRIVRHTLK